MHNKNLQLIRRAKVLTLTARSKSALQLDEKNGLFCPPVSIGDRAVAYVLHEVQAIVQARIEGKNKHEIQSLVSKLIENRKLNTEVYNDFR